MGSFVKRDTLRQLEKSVRREWQMHNQTIFESSPDHKRPKYFITFPFPYMNGRLHLGHAFSLSKAEFMAGYKRSRGFNVLFPFAFHGSGMPIKACSDRLLREHSISDNNKQTRSLLDMGVPADQISQFTDPYHWLRYFPEKAKDDLIEFGIGVDWRRSFVTTDLNPHFSSFVSWQMDRLYRSGYISFGKRHAIYSPKDGQPCMDHDRQTGEGVQPQEWTLIKLCLLKNNDNSSFTSGGVLSDLFNMGQQVSLLAATLRPETMYGQTNCFISPSMSYGIYAADQNEKKQLWICLERTARNLKFQGYEGLERIGSVQGSQLIGAMVKAPLSPYPAIPVLPMPSILPDKGSGIVTSVPSDSAADFIQLCDIKKKPDFYDVNIQSISEILENNLPLPIIQSPTFGNLSATTICTQMSIQSPKESQKLMDAKDRLYKDAFANGQMLVGRYRGDPVSQARPKVKADLISTGAALSYWEPEREVVSRSGDECVVALTDQYYVNYGDKEWRGRTLEAVEQLETYHEETKQALRANIDWLREWACSRKFGLGTPIPWDKSWLVESLSDSTIYMAYYTIAHYMDRIDPAHLTNDVWDYIFLNHPLPTISAAKLKIDREILEKMKNEFEHYYPFDLRVSGKDLINNHLTFSLYTHTAIWPREPEKWPRGMRANGHLMLNKEKMSKSTGNFMLLRDAVEKFGADATRMAVAEAGDRVEDANFDESVANAWILKLFQFKAWSEGLSLNNRSDSACRRGRSWLESRFEDEMCELIGRAEAAYEKMNFFDAVKFGWHELVEARDSYINHCQLIGRTPDESLLMDYLKYQCLVIKPITPHLCDYIWRNHLKFPHSILTEQWPQMPDGGKEQAVVRQQRMFMDELTRDGRTVIQRFKQKRERKSTKSETTTTVDEITLKIAAAGDVPEWQKSVVHLIKGSENLNEIRPHEFLKLLCTDERFMHLKVHRASQKEVTKVYMPFINKIYGQQRAALSQKANNNLQDNQLIDEKYQRERFDHLQFAQSQSELLSRLLNVSRVNVESGASQMDANGKLFRFEITEAQLTNQKRARVAPDSDAQLG